MTGGGSGRLPVGVDAGSCDVRALSAAFGVAERTAREWCAAGVFPGARRDSRGRWVVPGDEVARLIDGGGLPRGRGGRVG